MLNTMAMAVFERTAEIGLLRALGWKRRRVMILILGEALALGLIGTVFGAGLALAGNRILMIEPTSRSFIEPNFPPAIFGIGLAMGTVLSLIGGAYPAARPRPWTRPRPSAMTDGPLLRAEGLVKTYPDGDVRALRGVSLAVAERESVAITGPSGCGKSTLLQLLGGLDRPDSGEVYFRGGPLAGLDRDAFRARQLGFVFQSFHLLPTLTALENVQVPMFEAPWPVAERRDRAAKLLDEVGLGHRGGHRPGKLSVGERQRVAIARALANEPTLILADEPTGNLDSRAQADVLALLDRLRRGRSLTLVMVTHSHEVAAAADREVRLRDGRIVEG